ncbi:hypothetical protein [Myxococcus sp. CA039A]|uniref:hypothetical protein n=1 Tax=Myxococcus sp. CA039A TaxID=2741737 RepID=UPI00157A35BD|nr:hypothetical protein [Myxococcus sp. CA039A]NTX58149.1 hypothetical protein [Myxococcus sp. CA039A]
MRIRRALLAALLLMTSACDRRSDEEKRLEAERVRRVNEGNRNHPERLRGVATGEHNTTFLIVDTFPGKNEQEIREAMRMAITYNFEGGREGFEREGWLAIGYRDAKTGIEETRLTSAFRGPEYFGERDALEHAKATEAERVRRAEGRGAVATGENRSTLLILRAFPGGDEQAVRTAMEDEMARTLQGAGKEFASEGWLRVGFRDQKTGIEVTKPVGELERARTTDEVLGRLPAEKGEQQAAQQ